MAHEGVEPLGGRVEVADLRYNLTLRVLVVRSVLPVEHVRVLDFHTGAVLADEVLLRTQLTVRLPKGLSEINF